LRFKADGNHSTVKRLFVAISRHPTRLTGEVRIHLSDGFFWHKGGFEYPLMWLVLCLVIFFRGGGPYSLDRRIGKEL
jgi:uncharacterized membrane protein YphA (DoxX/SURF4 family)